MGSVQETYLKQVKGENDQRAERMIRDRVFIREQNVPREIEYDEYEVDSIHYLIMYGEETVGCIRYRWSGPDIKIERLAVLGEHRNKGFGRSAMDSILSIVLPLRTGDIYLHSQVIAKGFYERCGFYETGGIFREADIDHVKMILKKEARS